MDLEGMTPAQTEQIEGPARLGAAPSQTARRLLSVDDDPMQGRIITALFRDNPGIEVTAVHDPGEALELVASRPPDLLLLDLGLPGMSGLEVLQRVKASYPQVPVIVLTGFADV